MIKNQQQNFNFPIAGQADVSTPPSTPLNKNTIVFLHQNVRSIHNKSLHVAVLLSEEDPTIFLVTEY